MLLPYLRKVINHRSAKFLNPIVNHLNTHTFLLKSQHGFTKGKSCLTSLLSFLEDVTKAIDEGKPLDVIYLDFSKAFDNKRLLHKLNLMV